MNSRLVELASWLAICAVVLLSVACAADGGNPQQSLDLPVRDGFSAVSAALEPSCGTLDCHGDPARNLRIYGTYGLRADGNDFPGGRDTTAAEIDATYESLVSIQPEQLAIVLSERGHQAQRWIVIAKGRALQAHKGGPALVAGSNADDCVLSWLDGKVDIVKCADAAFGPIPRRGEHW